MTYKKILQTIKKHKSFIVVTHVGPDPDALGSQMAMALFLESLGKEVVCVGELVVPERYQFLPGVKSIRPYSEDMNLSFDAAVILDCGDRNRIGKIENLIKDDTCLINIDHHITNDNFGTVNIVDPTASSTCEMLCEFFDIARHKITDTQALHLYAGIMTDTGCFRFENTTSKTHLIASKLVEYNFSPTNLYKELYESIPLRDVQEFTKVINNFEAFYEKRVACVLLPKKIVKKFSEEFDLRDTIFKFLRSIQGIEVFLILTEVSSDKTRINFRSSGRVDVAKLANKFKGGGHKNASGGVMLTDIDEARKAVLKEIKKVL
ncbi:MAG: phosphoesterase RecJ-like protein [Candidatus Omnitrophota bacterium]|jgi:phosphoesterase RecJ-like protein